MQAGLLVFRDRQARALGLAPTSAANALRLLSFATVILQGWNGFVWGAAWPHLVAVATTLIISMASFFALFHEDDSSDPVSAMRGSSSVQ